MTINTASKHLHVMFTLIIVSFMTMTTACKHGNNAMNAEMAEMNRYRHSIEVAQDSGNYQAILDISKEFYEVSKKGHSDIFRAYAASDYSQELIVMGKPDEGKVVLDEAMKLSTSYRQDTLMMEIYNGYGLYEMVRGNCYAAAEYYLKSLEYARKCEKRKLMAVLSNLGYSMTVARDTTGLKYALEAYRLAEENKSDVDKTYALQRVIEQMTFRGRYDEARKYMIEFVEVAPNSKKIWANEKMANVYLLEKDYDKAHQYIDIAIAQADTSRNVQPVTKVGNYYSKANILSSQGRYDESNRFLDKAMELCENHNDKSSVQRVTRLYARNYEALGNTKEALKYRNMQLNDILESRDADRVKILKAKEVALDVKQKDEEIMLQREKTIMRNWMLGGALLVSFLLIVLCIYIYSMYRSQRKLMSVVVERAPAVEEKAEEDNPQVDERFAGLFQRMKEEIEEKKLFKDQNLSRDGIASLLGTNRSYITDATKMMTGMSFPQYISSLRISEAERMLQNPKEDVSNLTFLGESLGFSSLSAFQSTFKKYTGMTLSTYREIARKKRE